MSMSSLVARIDRLEDIQLIKDLSSRYALAVDGREYEQLGDLFMTDATFGGTSDGAPGVSGSERIVAVFRERLDAGGPTYHCVHDVAVTMDPENSNAASGVVTTHAATRTDRETVVKAVRYIDDYRRGERGWRFESRMLTFPLA